MYLNNPDGICHSGRHAMLDKLNELNRHQFEHELDPEIESRIAQYEMAFRMQTSVPDVTDLSGESEISIYQMFPSAGQMPQHHSLQVDPVDCIPAAQGQGKSAGRIGRQGPRLVELQILQ